MRHQWSVRGPEQLLPPSAFPEDRTRIRRIPFLAHSSRHRTDRFEKRNPGVMRQDDIHQRHRGSRRDSPRNTTFVPRLIGNRRNLDPLCSGISPVQGHDACRGRWCIRGFESADQVDVWTNQNCGGVGKRNWKLGSLVKMHSVWCHPQKPTVDRVLRSV